MTVLDYLGLGALAVGLVAVAAGVLWWQLPPARPYIGGALRVLSWLALAALVPLGIGILTRRRPRRQSAQTAQDALSTTEAERQQRVQAARERRAKTETRIQQAEDDGDLEALYRLAMGDDDA